MPLTETLPKVRRTLTRTWSLSAPYFQSDERWRARALLASIVALNLAAVYMLVLINDWNRLFYDALQNKDAEVFWQQLGRFAVLACVYIVIAVYKFYLTQWLEMRWRAWMTQHYLERWLTQPVFYRLELERFTPEGQLSADNPDQRIQEDINLFTGYTVSLSMGILNAVVTLASFVGILWTLSGSFDFDVAGQHIHIPGFMVWMAVLYCAAGSVATHYIGRSLVGLNFRQQKVEADFRHHMGRVREFSESIALDQGQAVEKQQLNLRFGAVLGNYIALLKAQKRLVWFTNFFGQAAVVFPFVVAAPRFFSGAIQLGELMQIASAFGRVQESLSWLVDNYDKLAGWRATTDRLTSFDEAVTAASRPCAGFEVQAAAAPGLHHLSLALPGGEPLLSPSTLQAHPGDRIWVQGPSGSGKSSLFRALAGIWPWAQGQVQRPGSWMLIPQRPYIPHGRLRDALTYPQSEPAFSDAQLQAALDEAQLPHLMHLLDHEDAWSQKLSGGEQQRLALARVLLRQPAWVLADEATSAMDPAAEQHAYEVLSRLTQAQGGGLISIAHRSGVSAFHNRAWVLQPASDGITRPCRLTEKP